MLYPDQKAVSNAVSDPPEKIICITGKRTTVM